MLRCVLGIPLVSGVSGATKFQLVHGIEANDLQQGGMGIEAMVGWTENLRYLKNPKWSRHITPWMETYGRNSTKKFTSPSFEWFKFKELIVQGWEK